MSHLAGRFPWTTVDPLQSLAIVPAAMAIESKLVRASNTTRTWLRRLHERIPTLDYTEAKYWATFKAGSAGAVAQLNPSHVGIRVFLTLDSGAGPDLTPSPSTRTWAARFPSVFQIAPRPSAKSPPSSPPHTCGFDSQSRLPQWLTVPRRRVSHVTEG